MYGNTVICHGMGYSKRCSRIAAQLVPHRIQGVHSTGLIKHQDKVLSWQSMFPPELTFSTIFPRLGGHSERLGAFRVFLKTLLLQQKRGHV